MAKEHVVWRHDLEAARAEVGREVKLLLIDLMSPG